MHRERLGLGAVTLLCALPALALAMFQASETKVGLHLHRAGAACTSTERTTSFNDQLAGVPIVLSADAVALTMTLGKTTVDSARRTLELVGQERVLRCILVPPEE